MPPMTEWPQIMEGNIAHTLMNGKHFIWCYGGDLQRNIVLLARLVTYNRVMLKVARILGVTLAPSNKKILGTALVQQTGEWTSLHKSRHVWQVHRVRSLMQGW